jgi:hypothetical protein
MVLVGKPEGSGPLGRPRRRWEDNSKVVGIQQIGGEDEDWIILVQDKHQSGWDLVKRGMNLRVP